MLNQRAQNLSPSPTMTIDSRAKQLMAQGEHVVNLSIGEPDFDTPDTAKSGAVAAIDANFTKYTPAAGILELREAIAEKLRRENHLDYTADEIVVSNGAKQSLFNIFMVLLEPSDEVIIQAPYWVSYPEIVKIAGGVPVIVKTDAATGFELESRMIERAVTKRSKALIVCNPSNPTGVVYGRERLYDIAKTAARYNLTIVSDEIYERLTYDGAQAHSIASLSDDLRQHTITVNGLSKTFSMTGWRLGYCGSPAPFAKAMSELQGHCTSGASSITQKAGVAALRGDQTPVVRMREQYDARRRYAIERIQSIPGFELEIIPQGAFYVFPKVSALFGRALGERAIQSSEDLCLALLDLERVAIVPGGAFGSPNHVRISYAAALETLCDGFNRMEHLLCGLPQVV
jgi:aspartate aminotransferase